MKIIDLKLLKKRFIPWRGLLVYLLVLPVFILLLIPLTTLRAAMALLLVWVERADDRWQSFLVRPMKVAYLWCIRKPKCSSDPSP